MRDSKGRFVLGNEDGFQKGHLPYSTTHRFEKGIVPWNKGKKMPKGVGEKISLAHRGKPKPHKKGVLNHFWKGGITPDNKKLRMSLAYRTWRRAVFERDKYTCQACDRIGGQLNADHIKPFSMFPKLRFEVSNGQTLCVSCHRETPTFGRKALTYQEKDYGFSTLGGGGSLS